MGSLFFRSRDIIKCDELRWLQPIAIKLELKLIGFSRFAENGSTFYFFLSLNDCPCHRLFKQNRPSRYRKRKKIEYFIGSKNQFYSVNVLFSFLFPFNIGNDHWIISMETDWKWDMKRLNFEVSNARFQWIGNKEWKKSKKINKEFTVIIVSKIKDDAKYWS